MCSMDDLLVRDLGLNIAAYYSFDTMFMAAAFLDYAWVLGGFTIIVIFGVVLTFVEDFILSF